MAAAQPSFDRLDAAVDLAIAELDEDGLADLAIANHETEDHVALLFGIAAGAFERRDRSRFSVGVSPHLHAVRLRDIEPEHELADVTGDGLADLITPNPDHVAALVAGEDGGFRPRATLPAPFGPFSVVAGNLTGDGRHDVAAASGESAGSLATYHGLADGSFHAACRYEIAGGPMKSAAADLTGDGSAEVLVRSYCGWGGGRAGRGGHAGAPAD